ncbi:hypothetical protein Q5424_00340 [Conexibacter sp. JD483]|uniref:hypothetical protein n=1 Tax=unclassified Conexibacter TaxID=2627773 RepID=UPI00271E572D|nr:MULTISPECIES: hypothetical protein [unclassified Conexibacter]MDO8184187.1 hypothetical protein [Conexibacter sp. CPCC 205706]MDO8197179.1 hypothetical protein [Conexibacter sp. CPCC 205762]MDR9367506.1 hypothetical protein [Conexibacter sp. JD483]
MTKVIGNSMEGAAAAAGLKRPLRIALALGVMALMLAFAFAGQARADFGIVPGTFTAAARDPLGNDLTQAGDHPDLSTSFTMETTTDAQGNTVPDGDLKDVRVDLPVGLVGDPNVTPRCAQELFNQTAAAQCPVETQVGVIDLMIAPFAGSAPLAQQLPVYNIDPPDGRPAEFGFRLFRSNVVVNADVRSGSDYGLTATIKDLPGGVLIYSQTLTLWGVPADSSHDALRYLPGAYFPGRPSDDPNDFTPVPIRVNTDRKAFFSSPTLCAGPPVTRIAVNSWQNPGTWDTDEATSPVVTGCDRLTFDPAVKLRPRAARVAAPSGYDVNLAFRQPESPVGLASSALKDAVVTLPAGTVVNPSSADGLQACSPAQIALDQATSPACPNASKIGTVNIVTPLLTDPLRGSIYLAQQTPEQLLSLYLVAEGSGVVVKLKGNVDPDPVTGQLKATFVNNPQLPVTSIDLSFKDGPRAPLSNPRTCGAATTTAALSPWSGTAAKTLTDTFVISGDGVGAGCPAHQFAPSFSAGTASSAAGAFSPLSVTFGRSDADEYLRSLTMTLPKGVLAYISAASLCGDAQAAAGTCGEESRIGSVTTAAGAGSNPLQLPGRVYITGPYKGAPFGLSIVVPAVAGPFDLGTVVVRAAIQIDRQTAQLTIVSDPLPTILKGIPLQIRMVNVRVDRSKFSINPTNCTTANTTGSVASTTGDNATVSSRFQATDCAVLPYKPSMTLKVGARGKLTAGKRTPLSVTLAMTPGQANNRSVQVTLPLALNARLDVVNKRRACTLEQFRADRCPMVVGTATAVTPLLRDPLKGNAYFVYTPARRLPDLVVRLKGQVDIDLVGKVTIAKDLRLQTTFDTVPDVPITKFTLNLASGGTNGPVGVVRGLCSAATRKGLTAGLRFDAQSGKRIVRTQKISVAGCGKAKRSTRRAAKK